MFIAARFFGDLLDGPSQGRSQGFSQHGSTGFADGRQLLERPILRTALPELPHQQTVRQHDQIHVPGLALAIAQLTVSHAQLLLAVPMKGLRACPTISIHVQHALRFPTHTVADQDLTRARVPSMVPEDQDAYFVIHFGNMDRAGEVPLSPVTTANGSRRSVPSGRSTTWHRRSGRRTSRPRSSPSTGCRTSPTPRSTSVAPPCGRFATSTRRC